MKCFGGVYSILPHHGIYDKQGFGRFDSLVDILNLLHEFLVNCQATRGIDNYNIVLICFGVLQRFFSNFNRVFIFGLCKYSNFYLLSQNL